MIVGYAVGFARPDRWKQAAGVDAACPWHAVEAHRPPAELDGEIELAVCGAIVQVWGRQDWERLAAGRTACAECVRATGQASAAVPSPAPPPRNGDQDGAPVSDRQATDGQPTGRRSAGRTGGAQRLRGVG